MDLVVLGFLAIQIKAIEGCANETVSEVVNVKDNKTIPNVRNSKQTHLVQVPDDKPCKNSKGVCVPYYLVSFCLCENVAIDLKL
jgi:hypothetical protein